MNNNVLKKMSYDLQYNNEPKKMTSTIFYTII